MKDLIEFHKSINQQAISPNKVSFKHLMTSFSVQKSRESRACHITITKQWNFEGKIIEKTYTPNF